MKRVWSTVENSSSILTCELLGLNLLPISRVKLNFAPNPLERQHERVTIADRAIEQRALAFHIGDAPPIVSHLIYAYNNHG